MNARTRLRFYATNPPEGSELRKAIAYGIDPSMTLHNMFSLTFEQRLHNAGRIIKSTARMMGKAKSNTKTR